MTKNCKALMEKAGILPKLRLGVRLPEGGVKPTGPHRVKIIEDKIIKKIDPRDGKEIEWIRWFVEENGEQKTYDTRLKDKSGQPSYLVQRFGEIPEGEEVILEMKKQGVKNYIQVTPVAHEAVEVDEDYQEGKEVDDIPY